jgi:hypothetical protein
MILRLAQELPAVLKAGFCGVSLKESSKNAWWRGSD